MTIDWEYQRKCYNRRNKSSHKTVWGLLKSLYDQHQSTYAMAEELLVSYTSVWKRMRAEGIKLLPRGRIARESKRSKAIRSIPDWDTLPVRVVAKMAGVSKSLVHYYRRRSGVGPCCARRWSDVDKAYLKRHYNVKSVDEIANRLDRSKRSIYNTASRLGIRGER